MSKVPIRPFRPIYPTPAGLITSVAPDGRPEQDRNQTELERTARSNSERATTSTVTGTHPLSEASGMLAC